MSEPITLSGEEFDGLLNMLMQRDPLIAALLQKQNEAQALARATAKPVSSE